MTVEACAALVERGDPDRFRAAMAAPVEARAVLFPLYAFNVEVSRAPWVASEPLIAEMRLQWWRDALAEIGAGASVRRHEVMEPLAAVLDPAGAAALDALIEARRRDRDRAPFTDKAALRAYLDATAGGLMWTAARLLGAKPEAERVVRDYGFAGGMASWLRALPAFSALGMTPLPPDTDVASLAREGLDRLRSARRGRAGVGKGRPALLPAWWAGAWLKRARHDPEQVSKGLALSEVQSRARLLWAVASGRV